MTGHMYIPYIDMCGLTAHFEPQISQALSRCVSSGRYINGAEKSRFERLFADYCGSRHCIGVGNGFDALTLILKSMKELYGWKDGDEVIVPAFTFVASAEAVTAAGLTLVLCDVCADMPVIAPEEVARLLTPRTRAIVAVHLYGIPCDMAALGDIAESHRLMLIEDAAQAHGTTWNGRRAGSLGAAAAFSFYPGKNLGALGDAGAVTTDSDDLAKLVRALSNYGALEKYEHLWHGVNSRMDELQAGVLAAKLPLLDADNAKRREIAEYYDTHIARTPEVDTLPHIDHGIGVHHIYPLLCRHRDDVQRFLESRGIQTLIHYPRPIHRQRAYAGYGMLRFPHAEMFAASELSLPISPVQPLEHTAYIVEQINRFTYENT